MNWPELTLGILTYDRLPEITQVAGALQQLIVYPEEHTNWLVVDDSSPGNYLDKIGPIFHEDTYIVRTAKRSGWGAAVNLMRETLLSTPYLYFTEDDYVPTGVIDLMLAVALMEVKPDIGMVRFRGTAGDHVIFHQFEADVSKYLPEHRHGEGLPGKCTYLQLDSGSPSLWLYSNGPHLLHRRFVDFYGPYPEGKKLGQTEEAYAHTVKDRMKEPGAPAVVIFPEWVPLRFDHIGKSYQGSPLDTDSNHRDVKEMVR